VPVAIKRIVFRPSGKTLAELNELYPPSPANNAKYMQDLQFALAESLGQHWSTFHMINVTVPDTAPFGQPTVTMEIRNYDNDADEVDSVYRDFLGQLLDPISSLQRTALISAQIGSLNELCPDGTMHTKCTSNSSEENAGLWLYLVLLSLVGLICCCCALFILGLRMHQRKKEVEKEAEKQRKLDRAAKEAAIEAGAVAEPAAAPAPSLADALALRSTPSPNAVAAAAAAVAANAPPPPTIPKVNPSWLAPLPALPGVGPAAQPRPLIADGRLPSSGAARPPSAEQPLQLPARLTIPSRLDDAAPFPIEAAAAAAAEATNAAQRSAPWWSSTSGTSAAQPRHGEGLRAWGHADRGERHGGFGDGVPGGFGHSDGDGGGGSNSSAANPFDGSRGGGGGDRTRFENGRLPNRLAAFESTGVTPVSSSDAGSRDATDSAVASASVSMSSTTRSEIVVSSSSTKTMSSTTTTTQNWKEGPL
jgi:hypothetical protein